MNFKIQTDSNSRESSANDNSGNTTQVCFDYQRGYCSYGGSCKYVHKEPERGFTEYRRVSSTLPPRRSFLNPLWNRSSSESETESSFTGEQKSVVTRRSSRKGSEFKDRNERAIKRDEDSISSASHNAKNKKRNRQYKRRSSSSSSSSTSASSSSSSSASSATSIESNKKKKSSRQGKVVSKAENIQAIRKSEVFDPALAIGEEQEGESDDEVGPKPLGIVRIQESKRTSYGRSMLPGEGDAIAQYVQKNMRVPRRGEVGWSGGEIEKLERAGYVMSGSRHTRMNAVRLKKENQVYSAEEKKALALANHEEKQQREVKLISEFREMLHERERHKKPKHK